jgi:diguanylate cyclase (GGDEF)-like protein
MGKDFNGTRQALGEGAMGLALETGLPVVVDDYQSWEHRSPKYDKGDWHAVVAVPLAIAGRPVGVIGIADTNPQRKFSSVDQRLLHLFAQQAVIAIENARLFAAEKRRSAELTILYESSAAITHTIDLPAVINSAVEQLGKAVDATSAYILSCDLKSGKHTVLAEYFSPNACELELISDLGVTYQLKDFPRTLEAFRAGKSLTVRLSDPDVDEQDIIDMSQYGCRSLLKVPMIVSDHIRGYAEIWESRSERTWTSDEIRLCQTLANQAAVAIDNARLYGEMYQSAITDPLTGVHNRRGMFEIGQRELERSRLLDKPLSAFMLDIDHFKPINDVHTHAIGDQVLISLARLCNSDLRESDAIGRYGGEEFSILLPGADSKTAMMVAERLRGRIEATPMQTDAGPISITVSIGVVCTANGLTDLAALLDQADKAMYAAKRAGRNRVVLAPADK